MWEKENTLSLELLLQQVDISRIAYNYLTKQPNSYHNKQVSLDSTYFILES